MKRALPIFALLAAACAADGPTSAETSRTQQAIIGGTASDESQDATVMLLHLDPTGPKRLGICTAALVAPRLVLTARHCVSSTDADVACDVDGTPLLGGNVIANHDAANLFVFTGKDRPALTGAEPPELDPQNWKPAGQGLEIIDDKSGTLCNHDLALLLLKDPIDNAPIASIRLDSDAKPGEKLLTVGWGVSTGEIEPIKRQQRGGVTVKRVGPDSAIPVLTKSEFLFDESICLGDSGGPVFSEATKAILGVVSRGGNGVTPGQGGPAATCTEADNVATKLSPFRELLMEGFQRAGAEPKLEPKEDDDGCSACATGAPHRPMGAMLLGTVFLGLVRRRRKK